MGFNGKVPLFVELCCGSAAVTLRLIGGSHARPPISYMGSKNGYATSILNVLGLRSGQGADAVVLCDAGPWARAWRLLTTPEGCRAVADVIRGWIGEDARALWDRLRAEPVPEGDAEAVGAWLYLVEMTHGNSGDGSGGYLDGPGNSRVFVAGNPIKSLAKKSALALALSWPPTIVSSADVSAVEPGTLPEGTVCMIDPPYKGDGTKKITGYAHDLSRAAVVEVALKWAAAGASVAVCEGVPVAELVALGWFTVEITACRVGQRRTFGPTPEWLTLSQEPAWVPAEQADLGGGSETDPGWQETAPTPRATPPKGQAPKPPPSPAEQLGLFGGPA